MQGIDFNGKEAKIIQTGINNDSTSFPRRYNTNFSASINDCNGQLLFYTNGIDVWNKHDSIMDNGRLKLSNVSNIGGMNRNCIIVPVPGNNSALYYIFYMVFNNYQTANENKFKMALVDMSKNNGLGTVVFKDSTVNDKIKPSPNLTYALHDNGVDFWILCSKDKDSLYSFLLDSNGLNVKPVASAVHAQFIYSIYNTFRYGFIKLNNDNSKLYASGLDQYNSPNGHVLVYDFDRKTGIASNESIVISHADYPLQAVRSLCFSPNDSFVYFSVEPDSGYTGTWYARIIQHNRFTSSNSIVFRLRRPSGLPVGSGPFTRFCIQTGPDDKSYIFIDNKIYRINSPNRIGTKSSITFWDSLNNLEYNDANGNKYGFDNLWIFSLPNAFNLYRKLYFNVDEIPYSCTDSTTFTYYGDTTYYKLVWHFGDGDSLIQTPPFKYGSKFKHVYKSDGTYQIRLESWHPTCNARKEYIDTIYVKLNPIVRNLDFLEINKACYSDTVQVNMGIDSLHYGVINWGDLQVDTLLSLGSTISKYHTFYSEDTFQINYKFISKNGCIKIDSNTFISNFYLKPNQNIIVNGHERLSNYNGSRLYSGCDTLNLRFIDSTVGTTIKTKYKWSNNDSSETTNYLAVNRKFTNDSTIYALIHPHYVTSTNEFGCSSYDTFYTAVLARPKVRFSLDTLFACLKGNSIKFSNTTTFQASQDSLEYSHEIENKRFSGLPSSDLKFGNSGDKSIKLIATTKYGCADSTIQTIKINPNPISKISTTSPSIQCLSTNSYTLMLNGELSYNVRWGDTNTKDTSVTNTGAALNHKYFGSGTFIISAIATDTSGCKDTSFLNLKIEAEPKSSFKLLDSLACLSNNKLEITTQTTSPQIDSITNTIHFGNGWKYSDYGNYTTTYTYPASGNYTIKLISESPNGCVDSSHKAVSIFKDPAFSLFSSDTCLGDSNLLKSAWNSEIKTRYIVWSSDDFNSIDSQFTEDYAIHTSLSDEAGSFTYNVTLIDSNNCKASLSDNYIVYNLPLASIKYERLDQNMDSLTYQFTDNSNSSLSREWDFDGEATGHERLQRYAFKDTGYRKVTLTIKDDNGCSDSSSIHLNVFPNFQFFFPNAVSANNDGINETFGSNSPQYIKKYELTIFDRWGGIIFKTNDKQEEWKPEIQGVYVYQIKIQDLYLKWHYYNGTITVLK